MIRIATEGPLHRKHVKRITKRMVRQFVRHHRCFGTDPYEIAARYEQPDEGEPVECSLALVSGGSAWTGEGIGRTVPEALSQALHAIAVRRIILPRRRREFMRRRNREPATATLSA